LGSFVPPLSFPSGFEDGSGAPDEPEGADEPPGLYPLANQPPPFNWNAVLEMSFSSFPLHASQVARGGSLNFWIFSKTFPQDVHRYS
jgi:hypothetical protein